MLVFSVTLRLEFARKFSECLWVKYRGCLRCLAKAANFSEFELWNGWVTWSLGVWLGGGRKESPWGPPIGAPRSVLLSERSIAVTVCSPPEGTVSSTCALQQAAPRLPLSNCHPRPRRYFYTSQPQHLNHWREKVNTNQSSELTSALPKVHLPFFAGGQQQQKSGWWVLSIHLNNMDLRFKSD